MKRMMDLNPTDTDQLKIINMILIVKKGEGQYDDYHEWVDSVWSIRKKKINWEKDWENFVFKAYVDAGLPVSQNDKGAINFTLLKKKQFKEVAKIYNSLNMHDFVKNTYKAKELKFQDIII